jgi:hypothetical protein
LSVEDLQKKADKDFHFLADKEGKLIKDENGNYLAEVDVDGEKVPVLVGEETAIKKADNVAVNAGSITENLTTFKAMTLTEKLQNIVNLWKTKYPLPDMFEGRTFFEDVMREYRYIKASGWAHTADIAPNFKGVDFYKDFSVVNNNIYAETAVSMKTTITKDVNKWLGSEPIQKNIGFLREGLSDFGIESNGKIMKITKGAEVHIYMPKENITPQLKEEWLNTLNKSNSKIKFEIHSLEDYIK